MGTALVSVIIPVYNAEKYLRECLDSVTNQSYKNIEIILVDDGSADSSLEICREASRQDARIRVIEQKNAGPSAARNAGLAKPMGEYIMFVDSDDCLPKNAVSNMTEAIEAEGAEICAGRVKSFDASPEGSDDSGQIYGAVCRTGVGILTDIMYTKIYFGYSSCAKLYRKSAIGDIKFPRDINFTEDLVFNYFVMKDAGKIVIIDNAVYFVRKNRDSLTRGKFSEKRMDGIAAIKMIAENADKSKNNVFAKPLACRLMTEAYNIFLEGWRAVQGDARERSMNECKKIMQKAAKSVIFDKNARPQERLKALFMYFRQYYLLMYLMSICIKIKKGIGFL